MNKSLALSLGVALSFGVAGVAAAAKPAPRPTPVEPPTYYDSAGSMIGAAWAVEGVDAVLFRAEGRVFVVEVELDRASGYGANWGKNKPVYFSNTGCYGAAYLQPTIVTGMSTAAAVQFNAIDRDLLMYVSFTSTPEQAFVSSVMSYDFEQQAHRCDDFTSAVQTLVLPVAQRYQINFFKSPFVVR